MNSGMYAALSGNVASLQRLDTLSNNLANINTPGFKRDNMAFEALVAAASSAQQGNEGPVLSGTLFTTDFSAGPVKQTGNVFDIAIDGDGFFAVETPDGPAYTRQGNFRLNGEGRLVTVDGYSVLAGGAPVDIVGGNVDINEKGEILVDGGQVGTLDVVDFPKPYALQKKGSALFTPTAGATPGPSEKALVRQGHLEDSNVNSVLEMARLIETTRYFESCQKAIRSYDEMAAKAANDLGKL